MSELPRNPDDFKIDALSPLATRLLRTSAGGQFNKIGDAMEELIEAGFMKELGFTRGVYTINPTLAGNLARERINCGIYDRHRDMYAARAERDARLAEQAVKEAALHEAIPGWGMF